jgi:outer membrane protein OmpA-like peptidoglycan-associated protein
VREVLDPILLSDTMRVSNPPTIRFTPSVKTEKRLAEWSLVAFSEGQDMKQFSSEDAAKSDTSVAAGTLQENGLPTRIDWTPPKQGDGSLKLNGALEFTLSARDEGGKSGFAHGFLPVEKIILPDKRIEQFSLVLFGFNKADISEQNQRIINFITSIIRPNSKISIAGYTDRTGDSAYNRTLSRQRATELARLIDQPLSKAQGFGEDTLIYDNSTPEGRFYCRTVNVSVETSK